MATGEPIEKVQQVGKALDQITSVTQEKVEPNPETFSRLMVEKDPVPLDPNAGKASLPTPMETAGQVDQAANDPSKLKLSDIANQANTTADKIDVVKQRLSTEHVELSRPVRNAMQRSLIHVDESLRIALSKVGLDYTPPATKGVGLLAPVQKFLGYLTNGQQQLSDLSTHLTALEASGKDVSPATMLALQLKMNIVTQQVEFFSSLLNKSLEGMKTIMNVQV